MIRWLLALAVAAAFVALDPAGHLPGAALRAPALGILVAGLALAAALGAGGMLVARTGRSEDPLFWAWALGAGIGLHAGAMTVLVLLGMVGPASSTLVLVLLAAGWLDRPRPALPRVSTAALLVGLVLLAPAMVEALAPATDTDELYYQLAIPEWVARYGSLSGGLLHPDHSRPLPVQVLYGGLVSLGGPEAARLWHLGVAMAFVLVVRQAAELRFGPGRGDLPALALLGSWSFLREAGLAYNNIPVALWLLLATLAVLDRRIVAGAWFGGLALAGKYTAAPAVVALGLVALWDTRKLPLPAVLGLVLPVAPWLLRNLARGDAALFPFAGWPDAPDFVFVYPEKYGVGHGAVDFLLLPFNLLFRAETDSFVFFGRLSLLWVLAALALRHLARADVRRILLLVLVGFTAWAASAQLLRYLVPLSGLAALLLGLVRPGPAPLLLLLVSLPANLAPAWSRAAARLPVVLGTESADTFLDRELPAWPAVRFVRDWVPAGDTVALLNAWPNTWIQQPYVLGSVEDHVPVRHWVVTHGAESVRALAREGVRWLLVGDMKYLRKSYRFLAEDVWRGQLRNPQETLEDCLRQDAVRVFAENHHAVWRIEHLDAPGAVP